MPWELQQVESLAGQPNPNALGVSQMAQSISRFLVATPTDFLEPLLSSPFGRVYKLFLERCCTNPFEQEDARNFRENLSQQLRQVGFQSREGHALLLALMPFFPPGNLKVEDAPAKLPGWLLELYRSRYEPPTAHQEHTKPQPSGQPSFSDRIFLNRMLGLSNLYYIDPEDQEILQELRQVRLQTVQLMLSATSQQLGEQFSADFGDRFWAMAQSGVQKEALDAQEVAQRDAIQQWLRDTPRSLHADGGIQRFAAALLFSAPGSVKLANPDQNLPTWFIEGFKRYCSMAAV